MAADDDVFSAASGFAQGLSSALVPIMKMKYAARLQADQSVLDRKQRKVDLPEELAGELGLPSMPQDPEVLSSATTLAGRRIPPPNQKQGKIYSFDKRTGKLNQIGDSSPGTGDLIQSFGETEGEKQEARRTAGLSKLKPKALKSIDSTVAGLTEIKTNIDKLLNDPDLSWGTGYMSFLSGIPKTKAKEIENTLKTIKSATSLDTLQEMRLNSPTGGALGNVSDAEGKRLENKRATLDPTDAKFRSNLEDLKKSLDGTIQRLYEGYESDFGEPFSRIGNPSMDDKKKQASTADDILKEFGLK